MDAMIDPRLRQLYNPQLADRNRLEASCTDTGGASPSSSSPFVAAVLVLAVVLAGSAAGL